MAPNKIFDCWLFILLSTMIRISVINNCQSPVMLCKVYESELYGADIEWSNITCHVNNVSENMIPVDLDCLEIENNYKRRKFDEFHLSLEKISKIDRPIRILNEHLFNFTWMEFIISDEIHIDKCPFCLLQNQILGFNGRKIKKSA